MQIWNPCANQLPSSWGGFHALSTINLRHNKAAFGVTCASRSYNADHVGRCRPAQIYTCAERPRKRHEPACSRTEQRTRASRGLSNAKASQGVGHVAGSRQQAQPRTYLQ